MPMKLLGRWLTPVAAFAMLSAVPLTSGAHGPTRQKVVEKVTINARRCGRASRISTR
jgi:hypothetical protein